MAEVTFLEAIKQHVRRDGPRPAVVLTAKTSAFMAERSRPAKAYWKNLAWEG